MSYSCKQLWILIALVWAGAGVCHAQNAPQPGAPAPQISTSSIDTTGGMPRLTINGQPVLPFIFFFNTAIAENLASQLPPQVQKTSAHGVHLYSMPFIYWPWITEGEQGEPDYSVCDRWMDLFIEHDPQAVFILRVWLDPPNEWSQWPSLKEIEKTDNVLFSDGSQDVNSIGSDFFASKAQQSLDRMVRHYEQSPYAGRILSYHIGAHNTSEWFPKQYREKGPDYSPANTRNFRLWLEGKYKTSQALANAWARPGLDFDTACVPDFEADRFPMRGLEAGQRLEAFYDLPAEMDWVDYSQYTSEITARRIAQACAIIKQACGGRKLTTAFYGYIFDLPGSFNGHLRTGQLLRDPNLDALVAPISYSPYEERTAGGASGFMTAVDSVAAHGRLWINEDDLRTHIVKPDVKIPGWYWDADLGQSTRSLDETYNVLQRNLGSITVHRAGTWWMDLVAAGWFDDDKLWSILSEQGQATYGQVYQAPEPYQPEVAVIVDEDSQFYVKNDWTMHFYTMPVLRNAAMKTGAQVGFYYLDDFLEGVVPPCKVYLFANAFYMPPQRAAQINAILDEQQALAIWQYAAGWATPQGLDEHAGQALTGLDIRRADGLLGSHGVGLLEGMAWGGSWAASPRPVVVPRAGTRLLGCYADGTIGAALEEVGRHRSVFVGDINLNAPMLQKLFALGGAHVWSGAGDVVHTDGRFLLIHTASSGLKTLSAPAGFGLRPLGDSAPFAPQWSQELEAGQSRWFEIKEF